jgi:amino acid transporter
MEKKTPASAPAREITEEPTTIVGEKIAAPVTVQPANATKNVAKTNIPLGGITQTGAWSLLSLLFSGIGIFVAILQLGGLISRRKESESELREARMQARRAAILRVVAIAAGLLTALVWIILENFHQPMAWINRDTSIIAILFGVTVLLTVISGLRSCRNVRVGDTRVNAAVQIAIIVPKN